MEELRIIWTFQKSTKKNLEAYEKAGGSAEQAPISIKTVVALCGEEKEVTRYKNSLHESRSTVVKYGVLGGFSVGLMLSAVMSCVALGLFYGSYLIQWKRYNPVLGRPYAFADVLSVLLVNYSLLSLFQDYQLR